MKKLLLFAVVLLLVGSISEAGVIRLAAKGVRKASPVAYHGSKATAKFTGKALYFAGKTAFKVVY